MALKLYTGGALFFGAISAGAVMVQCHADTKQISIDIANTPSEILTYDQFCKRNWVSFGSSCAVRIVDRTLSYPSYGMHCLGHGLNNLGNYEATRKGWAAIHYLGFQGAIGVLSGVIVGGTWPVSVPLIALEIAEQKYGYKLC